MKVCKAISFYLSSVFIMLLLCGYYTNFAHSENDISQKVDLEREYLTMSPEQIASLFASYYEMTDLQKEEFWKKYRGKWINWTGFVGNVEKVNGWGLWLTEFSGRNQPEVMINDILKGKKDGNIYVRVTDICETKFCASVFFKESWLPELLKLRKGEQIAFQGQLMYCFRPALGICIDNASLR